MICLASKIIHTYSKGQISCEVTPLSGHYYHSAQSLGVGNDGKRRELLHAVVCLGRRSWGIILSRNSRSSWLPKFNSCSIVQQTAFTPVVVCFIGIQIDRANGVTDVWSLVLVFHKTGSSSSNRARCQFIISTKTGALSITDPIHIRAPGPNRPTAL